MRFNGEFTCKLDDKGRLMVPSALLKQFPAGMRERFFVNKHIFQPCLVLYPADTWEKIGQKLGRLNRFVKKNDDFIRLFLNGLAELEPDSTNRIRIPKTLSEYAKLDGEIIMSASLDKIEIWSEKLFKQVVQSSIDSQDIASLSEDVMGSFGNDDAE